ncbi:hypothetical protein [Halorussus salinisoli]|uniref:hypothetical protein n=1 Tax=Halorussus salinisoli TaxID=2558242 RepID=UPI0010C1C198|nr:hypothetical protein [Halorussus salinisoli]
MEVEKVYRAGLRVGEHESPSFSEKEDDYFALDPPWFFANSNVIERLFQLRHHQTQLNNSFDELETLYEECQKQGTDAIASSLDISRHITDMMESAEVFSYNFPELARKSWWGGFTEDIAHAYWRIEKGRFKGAASDEETLGTLLREVASILENSTATNNSVLHQLRLFLDQYGYELNPNDVPEDYQIDVYEAQDLYCLGYYSTALMVLGRAVEKALLELGQVRDVRTIRTHDIIEWEDAKFYHRNKALREVNMPERHGKVLTEREYHQIAILIKYRNDVAHSEYEQVGREQALRQLKEAFDLLNELSDKIEYLEALDDQEIDPVEGQKAH